MAQSFSRVLIHAIFSTKHRKPYIISEVREGLHGYLATVLRNAKCPALKVGGTEDHVHLFFALHRTANVADLIEEVKSASSKWMKRKSTGLDNFYWQSGYGAFSTGQSDVERVIHYIENQEEHHKIRTFQEEYRLFLKKYGVEFDEKYLWD